MDFECRRCVTIEDIVHCFGDWQIHVVALIEVVNALGAVIAFCYYLHLQLRGLDAVATADHIAKLAVAGELRISCHEQIAQISRIRHMSILRIHRPNEPLHLLNSIAD